MATLRRCQAVRSENGPRFARVGRMVIHSMTELEKTHAEGFGFASRLTSRRRLSQNEGVKSVRADSLYPSVNDRTPKGDGF